MGSWGSDEDPPYKSLHRLKEKYVVATENNNSNTTKGRNGYTRSPVLLSVVNNQINYPTEMSFDSILILELRSGS